MNPINPRIESATTAGTSPNNNYEAPDAHMASISLGHFNLRGRRCGLSARARALGEFLRSDSGSARSAFARTVASPAGREVVVLDPSSARPRKMLMFGSNNYLGLANHPHVLTEVLKAARRYGVGIGGPPLLNGYTILHRELEERLAAFKHAESALLFSTGYGANLGLASSIVGGPDVMLYDDHSHASFLDGLKTCGGRTAAFRHNALDHLELLLNQHTTVAGDLFVGVEGVYSMDGDLAPLDRLVPLAKKHRSLLVVDDAHGTGTMGVGGRGTAEHFGVHGQIDITMGTFSKTFGMVGGFVTASRDVVEYLRFFARPHVFSASLPPPVIAAVLAGLDVIEREQELLEQLRSNVRYAARGLRALGHDCRAETPILSLRVPVTMNLYDAARQFHEAGLFVNALAYPAVPLREQRFRISLMADHQTSDIDRLLDTVEKIWTDQRLAPTTR